MFSDEAGIEEEASATRANILEVKWKSVLRLQKENMTLKSQLEQLKNDQMPTGALAELGGKSKTGLPKQPCLFECLGHKDSVTSLAFHPI